MYFKDYSKYSYNLGVELEKVKNIGWISHEFPFSVGESNNAFKKKLLEIIFLKDCNRMRGVHICDICQENYYLFVHKSGHILKSKNLSIPQKDTKLLGHSEICIPSKDGDFVYASPTLIYHYILEHHYLPSKDYIESVLAFDMSLDSEEIFNTYFII
ncbi:hypothetical protein AD998_17855 [bacterium 336/3]|nr:hypothetical protein AD998_17855 [bacterium 336/3]